MFHIVSFEYWDHYSYTVLQKTKTLVGQQTTHGESLGGPFFLSRWSIFLQQYNNITVYSKITLLNR